MGIIIETRKLSKSYGSFPAVKDLDLRVAEKEVFGLLGPNGAGKTTTILMLLGLTVPTSGEALVAGIDPVRHPLGVKKQVGYLPEKLGFYEELGAEGNLRYTAYLNGLSSDEASARITDALEKVGLGDVGEKPVGKFSHGMKQRLGIADLLIKRPHLAILDEPAVGIDPGGVSQMLELITRLNKDMGTTIVLCTHMLQQVERVCHRVGIMVRGQMVAEGDIEKLKRGKGYWVEVKVQQPTPTLLTILQKLPGANAVVQSGNVFSISSDRDIRADIAKVVVASGSLLEEMRLQEQSLEDIYRHFVKEAA